MYGIILFLPLEEKDKYITFACNTDGSIRTFRSLEDADSFAYTIDSECEIARVISLDGVNE